MKARVLVLAVLMSVVSINAAADNVNPSEANLETAVSLRKSLSKECILYNEVEPAPTTKIVYVDNATGNRTAKIVYHLDSESGQWIVSNRTEYKYDSENQLTQVVNYYWDKVNAEWTDIQVQDILR